MAEHNLDLINLDAQKAIRSFTPLEDMKVEFGDDWNGVEHKVYLFPTRDDGAERACRTPVPDELVNVETLVFLNTVFSAAFAIGEQEGASSAKADIRKAIGI